MNNGWSTICRHHLLSPNGGRHQPPAADRWHVCGWCAHSGVKVCLILAVCAEATVVWSSVSSQVFSPMLCHDHDMFTSHWANIGVMIGKCNWDGKDSGISFTYLDFIVVSLQDMYCLLPKSRAEPCIDCFRGLKPAIFPFVMSSSFEMVIVCLFVRYRYSNCGNHMWNSNGENILIAVSWRFLYSSNSHLHSGEGPLWTHTVLSQTSGRFDELISPYRV